MLIESNKSYFEGRMGTFSKGMLISGTGLLLGSMVVSILLGTGVLGSVSGAAVSAVAVSGIALGLLLLIGGSIYPCCKVFKEASEQRGSVIDEPFVMPQRPQKLACPYVFDPNSGETRIEFLLRRNAWEVANRTSSEESDSE